AAALVVELTPAEIAQSRLEQEPLLLGGQVYAASRQGVLLLYGQVPNADAYQAAIAIAKAVPGVSEVDAAALRIAAPALTSTVERLAAQFPDLAFAVEGSSVRISGSTTKTELQQVTAALAQVAYIGYIDASAVTLRAGYYLYTVQSDDSLASIAERELGDGEAWELLAFINRDQIADPDVIYPGMQLKIPQ
ncbi:MAG: LysM peptidoglycan-binding domain-containing protein, partial [Chloroflexi bacterium]|nr:LysM peptidoglycan-binding domain-containing protein [Chloroflexota bacterium]